MSIDLASYAGRRAALGYNGMLATIGDNGVINRVNEGATTIELGVAVASGVGVQTCSLVNDVTDLVIGVSVRHATSIEMNYPQYACVPVLEDGIILITPYENVTKNAPVYARISDGRLGVTVNALTTVRVPNARWEEAGVSTEVVPMKIDISPV